MTNQEAFETMVRHARGQGGRSLNGKGKCRYRGKNGTKCFVGALIPDADYTVMLEGKPAMTLLRSLPCLRGLSPAMLDRMQGIHDRVEREAWESAFSAVAHNFQLTLPPLEEASHA